MTQQTKYQNFVTTDSELHELFLDELADILNAEQQLTKALPKMAWAATSEKLTDAFETHLAETEHHITRLEDVFTSLEEPVQSRECKAMKRLLDEGKKLIDELKNSSALDAALIAAAQKIEHYEMASYATLCAWAEKMGYMEAFELLSTTLQEEKTTDNILTEIADSVEVEALY